MCYVNGCFYPQLESGREILGVILNEKLDEILKETMQVIQLIFLFYCL